MSPDMLGSEEHTRMIDFYSLGALLYEMLTGLPPFFCEDRRLMYERIQREELKFPEFISKDAVKVLKGLLQKDPTRRMGYLRGFEEVK